MGRTARRFCWLVGWFIIAAVVLVRWFIAVMFAAAITPVLVLIWCLELALDKESARRHPWSNDG